MPKACSFLTTLVIFGISVHDVLQDSQTDAPRDQDVLDLFCGAAAIHRAAVGLGLASTAFDKSRVPGVTDAPWAGCSEDLSSENGFKKALQLVKRLRPGGLLVMGPPCSSFVVLDAVRCRRNAQNNYRGDSSYRPVQLGNLLATVAVFLMTVACMRDVEVVFENPPSSVIWKFPVVKQVLDFFVQRSTCTPRCAWSTEPWGKRMLKRYKFACTGTWISHIRRQCRCPGRQHLQLTQRVWSKGRCSFSGKGLQLKKSAAYPDALGRGIVNAWRQRNATTSETSTSAFSVHKPRKALHQAGAKKMRKPSSACHCGPAWLQPSPGSACASSSQPTWLQPHAGTHRRLSSSATKTDSDAPAWLNPAPSSC